MKKQAWMFAGTVAFVVATVGLAGANPNDYEATRPHYAAALQGNAHAQTKLGTLYLKGAGVPQSDALALQWFLRAAQNSHAEAQLALSGMFANGQGVVRHDVLAYKWARLAETNAGDPDVRQRAAEMVNLLARRMPEPELAEARKLAGTPAAETALAGAPAPVPESASISSSRRHSSWRPERHHQPANRRARNGPSPSQSGPRPNRAAAGRFDQARDGAGRAAAARAERHSAGRTPSGPARPDARGARNGASHALPHQLRRMGVTRLIAS